MKRNILSILLLLIATCSWAQDKNASTDDKKQRIAIKPIIIDGEVTGVPDGTPVSFCYRVRKTGEYRHAHNTLTTTITYGKFHIEKKFIYKDDGDNEENVEYILSTNGTFLPVYANPGTKIKVTAKGLPCSNWIATSNHPLQKVFNEYWTYRREKTDNINKKIQEAYEADNDEDFIKNLERAKDSIIVVSTLDYIKAREFNPVFANELHRISIISHQLGNKELSERIRKLIEEKVPVEYNDDSNIIDAKKLLIPSSEYLKVGDKMPDLTFFDRNDKEHKLSEFLGKKNVVLQFSTKACGPCHAVRPEIEKFYAKHKYEVEVITISMDDEKTWKSEEKVSWSDWNDHTSGSSIGSKFNIPGYPYYVIIRPDGVISSTFPGNNELLKYFDTFQDSQAPQSSTDEQTQSNSQAKDFTLYDRKGKVHKLSEFKGKYIVLMFTVQGCKPCLEAKPILDGFYKRHKDKVEVIAISADEKRDWLKEKSTVSFHEWNDYNYALELSEYYGMKTSFVIIHPNGNIINKSQGRLGPFFRELIEHIPDAEIENMLKNRK